MTTVAEPKCHKRQCLYFKMKPGKQEKNGALPGPIFYCNAFPGGIPNDITYGDNKHEEVIEGQKGTFIYKRKGTV